MLEVFPFVPPLLESFSTNNLMLAVANTLRNGRTYKAKNKLIQRSYWDSDFLLNTPTNLFNIFRALAEIASPESRGKVLIKQPNFAHSGHEFEAIFMMMRKVFSSHATSECSPIRWRWTLILWMREVIENEKLIIKTTAFAPFQWPDYDTSHHLQAFPLRSNILSLRLARHSFLILHIIFLSHTAECAFRPWHRKFI